MRTFLTSFFSLFIIVLGILLVSFGMQADP